VEFDGIEQYRITGSTCKGNEIDGIGQARSPQKLPEAARNRKRRFIAGGQLLSLSQLVNLLIRRVDMFKKMIATVSTLFLLICFFSSSAFASEQKQAHDIAKNTNGTYDGFWMQGTIPTLYPRWSNGAYNKINYEFWHVTSVDNTWVEMGYHNGYDWYSDGSEKPSSQYTGAFTARQTLTSFKVVKLTSLSWAPSQNHTMGTDFWYDIVGNRYVDMRSDQQVVYTWDQSAPGSRIDAGLEFGQYPILASNNPQTISLPSSIYNLTVRPNRINPNNWVTWNNTGTISTIHSNPYGLTISPIAISYSSTTNKINFN
jgi:hypothetical protein